MADQIIAVQQLTLTPLRRSPFITEQKARVANIGAAGDLLGVDKPSQSNEDRVVRFVGNGVKTEWTETELPLLALANLIVGAPTASEILENILRVNFGSGTPGDYLTVVDPAAPAGAGEFRIFDDGGTITLQIGTAPLGQCELVISQPADVDTYTLAQHVPQEIPSPSFVATALADDAVNIERLLR